MKTIILTDEQAAVLHEILGDVSIATSGEGADERWNAVFTARAQLAETLPAFTKETYAALPVANFQLIDQVADHARQFVGAQNRYNDIKVVVAAAVTDYALGLLGYKSRKA